MKLTVVSNLYPPFVRGGAEYLASNLVRELVKQGHEVSVVTSAPRVAVGWRKVDCRLEDGVRVYRLYPWNVYYYLAGPDKPPYGRFIWQVINLFNWPVAWRVKKLLRIIEPQAVISFNLMGLSFWLPRAIDSLRIKHLHTLHDVQLLHPSGLFFWGQARSGRGEIIYQFFTRWLFSYVKYIVSPSRWLLNEHQQRKFFKQSQVAVIPNPAPNMFSFDKLVKSDNTINLCYVGQVREHKGIFWLVETLKNNPRSDWMLHLVVVGDSNRLEFLRRLIDGDDRLIIHENYPQVEIDKIIARSHLTIVPSLCLENAPTIITMSKAQGTPILAVRSGGIPEMIDDGVTGWLFTPGDKNGFNQQLERLLNQPDLLIKAGHAALRLNNQPKLSAYVSQLLQLLDS
ncbi:MAG: glycosyltransferase [Candidatus Kerfeldbacteria bacterium]|nr:glycosyltransferase [Candidatus Kerfeldbacteria bacterium]